MADIDSNFFIIALQDGRRIVIEDCPDHQNSFHVSMISPTDEEIFAVHLSAETMQLINMLTIGRITLRELGEEGREIFKIATNAYSEDGIGKVGHC